MSGLSNTSRLRHFWGWNPHASKEQAINTHNTNVIIVPSKAEMKHHMPKYMAEPRLCVQKVKTVLVKRTLTTVRRGVQTPWEREQRPRN